MSTFKNFVQCRVITPITAVEDSIGLYDAVPPYTLPSEEGGLLVLTDSPTKPSKLEVISYTSRSALGLYGVTRGLEGTSALEWTGPVYCYQSLLAGEFKDLLDSKVVKVAGKQLSDENYTLTEKQKLADIAVEATKNRADSENADKVHTHTWAQVTGQPDTATRWPTFAEVTGKPTSFTPTAHTHPVSQVTGLGTAATANLTTSALDGTTGRVLKVGDGGWMGQGITHEVAYGYPTSVGDVTNQTKVFRASVEDEGILAYSGGFHFATSDGWGRLRVSHGGQNAWIQGGRAQIGTGWTSTVVLSSNLRQTTGSSTDLPMSQKAVTDQLATLGTAATANLTTSATDGTAGRVLKVGDGGWMGEAYLSGARATPYGYPTSRVDDTNKTKVLSCLAVDNGVVPGPGFHFSAAATWGRLRVSYSTQRAWIQSGVSSSGAGWTAELYHTGNTTKNPDGTLKASSPVINLYTDKHDLHNESQFGTTPAVVRKSKGVYEITGTLGLRSEGWYLDTPSDRNGNKYFNIEWTQNTAPDVVDGVVDEYRDDIVVIIETFERVWNKDTGLFENGAPIDINDLQDRFVQLRFNELKVEHEELEDDSN